MTRFCSAIALAVALAATAGCDTGPTDPDEPVVRYSPPGEDPDDPHPALDRTTPGDDGPSKTMAARLGAPGLLPDTDEFTPPRPDTGPQDPDEPLPLAECTLCGDPNGCHKNYEALVCFAQCSGTGTRMWDLGLLQRGQCTITAEDFCAWNGLGVAQNACWGAYL